MSRLVPVLLGLGLFSAPAAAIEVDVTFDPDARFGEYETFELRSRPEISLADADPTVDRQILTSISMRLREGGLTEARDNPDLIVSYYASVEDKVELDVTSWGYAYGPSWTFDPNYGDLYRNAPGEPQVIRYELGTLIIDAWDAETGQLVWRGTSSEVLPEAPAKRARLADRATEKIVKVWRKKRKRLMKQRAKAARGE